MVFVTIVPAKFDFAARICAVRSNDCVSSQVRRTVGVAKDISERITYGREATFHFYERLDE